MPASIVSFRSDPGRARSAPKRGSKTSRTVGVPEDRSFGLHPFEGTLVEALEATEPIVVRPDEAQHLTGQGAARVVALRLLAEADARQVELPERLGVGVVELARDPDERLRALEPRLEAVLVDAEELRDRPRRGARVLNLGRHGEGRVDRHRDR